MHELDVDFSLLNKASYKDKRFELIIYPFAYKNGKFRLPRKSSKNYSLMKDTILCFNHFFKDIIEVKLKGKFCVKINVFSGKDKLGGADLDNYCKAILDGITKTKKV